MCAGEVGGELADREERAGPCQDSGDRESEQTGQTVAETPRGSRGSGTRAKWKYKESRSHDVDEFAPAPVMGEDDISGCGFWFEGMFSNSHRTRRDHTRPA